MLWILVESSPTITPRATLAPADSSTMLRLKTERKSDRTKTPMLPDCRLHAGYGALGYFSGGQRAESAEGLGD